MKLKATQLEYEFADASGYRFHVVATLDPEFGWSATVSIASHGMRDAEGAIRHLVHSARAFVRQVDGADEGSIKGPDEEMTSANTTLLAVTNLLGRLEQPPPEVTHALELLRRHEDELLGDKEPTP